MTTGSAFRRRASAEEAVALVRSGARVFVHGGAATPLRLLDALVAQAHRLSTSSSSTCTRRGRPPTQTINSAVEIDLTGQVCADSIGHRIISGVGGQMDFMRGAALSQGGKPILALPSRPRLHRARRRPRAPLAALARALGPRVSGRKDP